MFHPTNGGPSRQYDPTLPHAAHTDALSPSFPQTLDTPAWSDGYGGERGTMSMPGPGVDSSLRSSEADASKRNPLVDLMDTEKVYVEQLGLVIRVSTSFACTCLTVST